MSLNDRSYMRNRTPNRFGISIELSPVNILIAINIIIFFLDAFVERIYSARYIVEYFALSTESILSGRVWTIVTYSFLHADIMHILFNMLGLFFVGRFVEKALGVRKFLALYFSGAIVGGLIWWCLSLLSPQPEVLIGASASVMAVFAGFCLMYPPMPITFLIFMVIPISMRPMTMLKIVIGFESLMAIYSLVGGDVSIAYSAHLGGVFAAILFMKLLSKSKLGFIDNFSLKNLFKTDPKSNKSTQKRASDYPFSVNISNPEELSKQVDCILDKINKEGFASLSNSEREILRKAKDNLQN